jgi:hypothetical protein
MTWMEIKPYVEGAAVATAFWIIGYIAKHLLDWLVKPKIADWWARRSDERALKQAKYLTDRLQDDIRKMSDLPNLIVRTSSAIRRLIILSIITNCTALAAIIGKLAGLEFVFGPNDLIVVGLIMCGVGAMAINLGRVSGEPEARRLEIMEENKAETIRRVRRLLESAKRPPDEIDQRINFLTALKAPERRRPGPAWCRIHTYRLRIAACLLVDIEPNDPNDEPPQEAASMYQALDQAWHANELDRVPGTFPGARIVTRASLKEFAAKRGIEAPFLSD